MPASEIVDSSPSPTTAVQYSDQAIARAQLAVRCSPFQLPLFITMRQAGVSLRAIATTPTYTRTPLTELAADTALSWLVQVGLLRREVDGQGLTDSYRLTPLGRQLVDQWETAGFPDRPSIWERLVNALTRWLRLPVWLQ